MLRSRLQPIPCTIVILECSVGKGAPWKMVLVANLVFKIPSWNQNLDLHLSWKLVYDHERVIHTKRVTQRAIFVDFRTEIGRSQSSHFLFLNIARTPHTTQSDLVFFDLSPASCMLGRIDIKWGALLAQQSSWYFPKSESLHTMSENEKTQGRCRTERTNDIFQSTFSKPKCELFRPGQSWAFSLIASQKNVERWSLCKEAE